MGFNTACIISNDQLHNFASDPAVGEKVQRAVLCASREGGRGPYGFKALPSQHADTAQVVVITANNIKPLGHGYWRDDDEALLRKLADQHGFRLVRKRANTGSPTDA